MTKLRNKLILVLLALCIVACFGVVVACGGDTTEDSSVTYTVTVKAGDAAAEGVKVTVRKGSAILGKPKATDKDGKAEFDLAEDNGYTVTLSNLPEGYELPADATLTFDAERKLTVTLSESFAYNIKLVDPDGNPYTADGVMVGICTLDGNCLNPVALGADGVASVYGVAKTDYHIQVLGLPVGYAYEGYTGEMITPGYAMYKNADGIYVPEGEKTTYVSLSATTTEATVTVYPVNVIDFQTATELTEAEINAYTKLNIEGYKAYKVTAEIEAGDTAYYTFTADYGGEYNVYVADNAASYKTNSMFVLGDVGLFNGGSFNNAGQKITATAEQTTHYINVTNKGEAKANAEFIITTPVASESTVSAAGAVKAVINKQGANAVIVFTPPKGKGAAYKLSVQGECAIKQTTSATLAKSLVFTDADYTNSKEVSVKYTEDMTDILYFAVSIKADKYPATVDVKIVKTGDNKNTTEVVENAALKKFEDQDGKDLIPLTSDDAAKLVKGDDGYYHIGGKNGNLVVVVLAKGVGKYTRGIIYSELEGEGVQKIPYIIDVTSAADNANPEKGKTFKDYRTVLRGFDEYKAVSVTGTAGVELQIPTDILVENYYANTKFVNSDGAYPLDDTLKEFLTGAAAELNNNWYFACYYYDDPHEADPIVGEYATEDNAYVLTIDKYGTFVIVEVAENSDLATGTWEKTDDGYEFTCDLADLFDSSLTYDDGELTYTDELGSVTFRRSALFTSDGKAKLKFDEEYFHFYLKDDGGFVEYAYGKTVGGDEENPEIEILEKHESVKGAQVTMTSAGEGEDTRVLVKVKVTYTDDSVVEYVFDMTDLL